MGQFITEKMGAAVLAPLVITSKVVKALRGTRSNPAANAKKANIRAREGKIIVPRVTPVNTLKQGHCPV